MNECKDISAPGSGIYSAWASQADAYATLSGTSQATAIVSGVFSMLFAQHPNLSVEEAKDIVCSTAAPVPGQDATVGIRAAARSDAGAAGGASGAPSLQSLAIENVTNGSHGAVDAAAALEYADHYPGLNRVTELPAGSAQLAATSFTYTGKALTPQVTVVVNGKQLASGTDYTVSYSNNKNPGTGSAVVTGKGAYSGTLTCTFKIALGKAKLKKAKAAKKAFTVKWARRKNGKVGYQVRYSVKKSMKGAKSKRVKKNATTKLKVKKLKGGKKYYVQVRTYKKIGKKTYYSAWSARKAVKVK